MQAYDQSEYHKLKAKEAKNWNYSATSPELVPFALPSDWRTQVDFTRHVIEFFLPMKSDIQSNWTGTYHSTLLSVSGLKCMNALKDSVFLCICASLILLYESLGLHPSSFHVLLAFGRWQLVQYHVCLSARMLMRYFFNILVTLLNYTPC